MPERESSWAVLVNIVDRPGTALTNVAAFPRWRWLLPAVLAGVALATAAVLTAPLLTAQTQQQAQELLAGSLSQLSAEQTAQVQARMAAMQTPLFLGATTLGAGILGLVLGWLVQATVLYFGALIAGADLEFTRIFATTPWLGLPYVLETIVQTAYVKFSGRLIVNQGLSYLASSGKPLDDARDLAYGALSQVTIFRLWHLVLAYVLLRSVARLERGAAFWLTVIYAALFVAAHLLFTVVPARLLGGV